MLEGPIAAIHPGLANLLDGILKILHPAGAAR